MTIKETIMQLGGLNTQKAISVLASKKIEMHGAKDMLPMLELIAYSQSCQEVKLMAVTPEDLGLERTGPWCIQVDDLYREALRAGLSLCPAEVAVQFWLQRDTHQTFLPYYGCMNVAMPPIQGCYFYLQGRRQDDVAVPCIGPLTLERTQSHDYWIFCS